MDTVNEGLKLYPAASKLYMIKGQILSSEATPDISAAREIYSIGVKKCPSSVPLWILASRLEEQAGLAIRARAVLERGRSANPRNDELWLESVRCEERQNNAAQGKVLMSRGMQTFFSGVNPHLFRLCQHCKSVPPPASYGLNQCGWKEECSGRQNRLTP